MPTMDRFTRFKVLRALWARAKNLLAWLYGPRAREERGRAHRWTMINIGERLIRDDREREGRWPEVQSTVRLIRDGHIRGTGDPDSTLRVSDTTADETRDIQERLAADRRSAWHRAAHAWHQQRQQRGRW